MGEASLGEASVGEASMGEASMGEAPTSGTEQYSSTEVALLYRLFKACEQGNLAECQTTILHLTETRGQTSFDTRDYNGQTAFYDACCFGQRAVADYLITRGTNVNAVDNYGRTPLNNTLIHGADLVPERLCSIVDLLLQNQADPNLTDEDHIAPLYFAIEEYPYIIVELLLLHGADPDLGINEFNSSPLSKSIACRRPDITRLLLQHGANVDFCDIDGRTAVMDVVSKNVPECYGVLCDYQADLYRADENGDTALHIAVQHQRLPFVELFAAMDERLALVDRQNHHGCTAVRTAAEYNYPDIIGLLLRNNANPDIPDINHVTPIMMAISEHHVASISVLLLGGASVVHGGGTVLDHALYNGLIQLDVVILLLEHGVRTQFIAQLSKTSPDQLRDSMNQSGIADVDELVGIFQDPPLTRSQQAFAPVRRLIQQTNNSSTRPSTRPTTRPSTRPSTCTTTIVSLPRVCIECIHRFLGHVD